MLNDFNLFEMNFLKIIAALQSQEVKLNKGTTTEQLAAAEEVLGFKFPSEFTQFYLLANGFGADSQETNGLFTIWSLEEILKQWPADSDENFISFGDYLCNSHHICFLKTKPGIFKRHFVENEDESAVCTTFSEALILTLQNNSELQ